MVASLSTGRPKYAAYETTLARCGEAGRSLAAEFLRLADRDAEAYAGYAAALKLPRETEEQRAARKAAIETAVKFVTGNKLKSMAAGKMGYSTTEVGDLVADLVAKA